MKTRIFLLIFFTGISGLLKAQNELPKKIRVVDSLTVHEKATRNPVLLQSEVDSLVAQYLEAHPVQPVEKIVRESANDLAPFVIGGIALILVVLVLLLVYFYRHQRKINRIIAGTLETDREPGLNGSKENVLSLKNSRSRSVPASLEKKINVLDAELRKLAKENEGLNGVIREYNGIQHEYDSLRTGLEKTYKVRNYPGYDKSKSESLVLQGVLDTEASVANYAYEKFLKPILVIADANKNHPAKLSTEHSARLVELLVSLSLLYIEYLYLRVNELTIGGKMVERIRGFSKGNGLDPALLKKLDTEFGSRALVVRMALNKMQLQKLSYPVFDETNLNPQ